MWRGLVLYVGAGICVYVVCVMRCLYACMCACEYEMRGGVHACM